MDGVDKQQFREEMEALDGRLSFTVDDDDQGSCKKWNRALSFTTPQELYNDIARIWPHRKDVRVSIDYNSSDRSISFDIIPDVDDYDSEKKRYYAAFVIHPGKEIASQGAFLNPSEQATGIATKLRRFQVNLAHEFDCKELTLEAKGSTGAYAWVRMGFKPVAAEWAETCEAIRSRLSPHELKPHEKAPDGIKQQSGYAITREQYDEISKCLDRARPQDALRMAKIFKTPVGYCGEGKNRREIKLAQVLLCGERFNASLPLDPEQAQYREFWDYTNNRLRELGQKPEDWHGRG